MNTTAGLLPMQRWRVVQHEPIPHLQSESTFSRAFGEFAQTDLAGRAHEALIKEALAGKICTRIAVRWVMCR